MAEDGARTRVLELILQCRRSAVTQGTERRKIGSPAADDKPKCKESAKGDGCWTCEPGTGLGLIVGMCVAGFQANMDVLDLRGA